MTKSPAAPKTSQDEPAAQAFANINIKVTEEEKWAFKTWCAQNRMTQVEAFRRAFDHLRSGGLDQDKSSEHSKE